MQTYLQLIRRIGAAPSLLCTALLCITALLVGAQADALTITEHEINVLETEHWQEWAVIEKEMTDANQEVEDILQGLTPQSTNEALIDAVNALGKKIEALEKARSVDGDFQIACTEQRYLDACQVIANITGNALSLRITTEAMSIVSEFQSATSPFEIESFRRLVSDYSKAMEGSGNGGLAYDNLNRLSGLGGFFASPVAGVIYSVVSLFQCKKPRDDDKPDKLQEIAKVVDVSLRARDDAIGLRKSLDQASEQLQALGTDTSAFFSTYAGTVGYTKSLKDFNREAWAPSELSAAVKAFFQKERESVSPTGLPSENMKRVRYNLRMLSNHLARYGEQVRSVSALLSSFSKSMEKYAAEMESIPKMKEQAPRLKALAERTGNLSTEVSEAYLSKVIHWESILMEY